MKSKESKPLAVSKPKGDIGFKSHLFKLEPAPCKKNKSWQKNNPDLHDIEHCHFYHSKDSKGRSQVNSVPIADHFHKIELKWDGDKLLSATCSPPLTLDKTRRGSRVVRTEKQVRFPQSDDPRDDIIDEHVHEITYLGYDELSSRRVHENVAKSQAQISSMMEGAQVKAQAAKYQEISTTRSDLLVESGDASI